MDRYSAYRVMWVLIFFDLPTDTKRERKKASDFRQYLIRDGFTMFQFSIYIRHCASKENADVHIKRVKNNIPDLGSVGILCITDKQFETMELYISRKETALPENGLQLELF